MASLFLKILGFVFIVIGVIGVLGYFKVDVLGVTVSLQGLMLLFLSETASLIFWLLMVLLGFSFVGFKVTGVLRRR